MAQISWTLIVFLVCFCVSSVFWCPVETLHTGSRSDPDPDDNGDNQQPAMADLLRRLFTVSESKEQDQQDANTANDISIIPAFDTESLDTAVAEHTWQFPINGRMHPALHKRTPNYFCGPRIPEILATICGKNNHGRPHWPRVRRSIQGKYLIKKKKKKMCIGFLMRNLAGFNTLSRRYCQQQKKPKK